MRMWKPRITASHTAAAACAVHSLGLFPMQTTSPASLVAMPSRNQNERKMQHSQAPALDAAPVETAVPVREKPSRQSSLELLKKLPSPADEPASEVASSQFMRMRSQHIARCLANIDHCMYPIKRDAETLMDAKSSWELALAALDEQLPRVPANTSLDDLVAGTPGSLDDPDGLEWDTAVLRQRSYHA